MLDSVFKVLWSVISFFFNLIWSIISHFWYVLIIALVAWLIITVIKDHRDEKWLERYEKSRSPEDRSLEIIAEKICSKFKRVELQSVLDLRVRIGVTSQSGNSSWNCIIDFNDSGKLTGKYHIISYNDQSNIPNHVAEAISKEIIKNF